jgi:hypothetical protein
MITGNQCFQSQPITLVGCKMIMFEKLFLKRLKRIRELSVFMEATASLVSAHSASVFGNFGKTPSLLQQQQITLQM